MRQNRVHVRLLIVAGVALLWTTGVFGRLSYLQLIKHGEYLARAQRQQQRTIEITPKRGIIYDRNMRALAMSVPVKSAFAVPAEIADESLAARLLSGVLGVPQDVLEARMASSRSFVWISRKLPPEKVEAIEGLNLKGVYFQDENQRFYPKRDLAAHVLGFVDPDEKGLAGIEYELDNQIRSKSEKIVVMADARQRWFDGGEAQRERGANVILTLDEKIQYIAQRELLAAIEKTRAIAGSVIVVNPNTGEILAMANWPRFNPNAANEAASESRMNRAVSALYEPGSVAPPRKLERDFHWLRFHGAGDWRYANPANHRCIRHRERRVADEAPRCADDQARGEDCACGRSAGCSGAKARDPARNGSDAAPVDGRSRVERHRQARASGRLDCRGQDRLGTENRSGDRALFADATDCFLHRLCAHQQSRGDHSGFARFAGRFARRRPSRGSCLQAYRRAGIVVSRCAA